MKYMSTSESGGKMGILLSPCGIICNEGGIEGAHKAGAVWIIPQNAEKSKDTRIKSGKYIKIKLEEGEINKESKICNQNFANADGKWNCCFCKDARRSEYRLSLDAPKSPFPCATLSIW